MPAYLRELELRPRCLKCRVSYAKAEVFNRYNAPQGRYCLRCAKAMVAGLDAAERRHAQAMGERC
jgi:hypothetical protein